MGFPYPRGKKGILEESELNIAPILRQLILLASHVGVAGIIGTYVRVKGKVERVKHQRTEVIHQDRAFVKNCLWGGGLELLTKAYDQ